MELKITGILETCLYAKNLDEAKRFYCSIPGLKLLDEEKGRHLFFSCGSQMLLIFNPEHTGNEQTEVNGSHIPLHGTTGRGHIAFSIDHSKTKEWKDFLLNRNIEIESEVNWPNGTISLYFRDPACNSLEIVSPKLWQK